VEEVVEAGLVKEGMMEVNVRVVVAQGAALVVVVGRALVFVVDEGDSVLPLLDVEDTSKCKNIRICHAPEYFEH
jgi:hypothetical protein